MTKPIGVTACLCLLALQFSGLHMHMDADGYVGGPEAAHSHSQRFHDPHDAHHSAVVVGSHDVHDDHGDFIGEEDYEGTKDVSFDDLALSSVKLPLSVSAQPFLPSVVPLSLTLASTGIVHPVLSGRYTRWRPPLRAPPQLA